LKALDLKADSEKTKDEANALASTILASPLEEKSSKILREALRQRLVEEISQIVKDLDEKVHIEEKNIQDFPALYGGKVVAIYFFIIDPDTPGAGYKATLVARRSRKRVDALRRREGDVWYARPRRFLGLVENLKQEILEGKHDEKLRTNSARVIYDLLKDRV
jgi:hypothetical protein